MTIVQEIEYLVHMFEEIEQYIIDLIAHTIGQNPFAKSITYWRRRAQMVHAELESLRKEILKVTPDVVNASYRSGYMAVTPREPATTGANVRAIALLAAGMNDRLDASLATVGRRVDDSFRKAGLRASAYHATAGTDYRMAAKHMQQQLERDGTRAFVDRAGREWGLKPYTRMVIRTTTREAMSQGSFKGLIDTGNELVKVSHHASSCDICKEWDGQIFCLPNANEALVAQYPILKKLPPFHPNCKHSIGPAGVQFEAIEAQLLAAWGAPAYG
jgi:hypothetical protein